MKYYYVKDGQQAGPVEESELIGLGITPKTLVWCNGMADWTKAGNVSELAYLFAPAPPSVGENTTYSSSQPYVGTQDVTRVRRKWLVFSILAICFCSYFGIPGIIWWAKSQNYYGQGKYAEAANAAKVSEKWAKIGFWIGIAQVILYMIYYISILAFAASYSYYY